MIDVAIIDSGIGGLSLFSCFFKCLPFNKYLYFADIKNLPYGNKTKKQLFNIAIKNIKYIAKKYKPKYIVFGCNTVGTILLKNLKNYFSNLKIFAIKPSLKVKTKTLILATCKTIRYLKKNKDYILNKENIILCKMPSLANKVEKYIQNPENIVPYLKRKLKKYKGIDCVVLGCTHYYFVKKQIENILSTKKLKTNIAALTKEVLFETNKTDLKIDNTKKIKVKIKFSKKPQNKKEYKNIISKMINENRV